MNQHTPAAGLLCAGLIGYCRAGFEKELAAELDDLAAEAGLIGYVRAEPNSGFVVYETFEPTPLGNFGNATDWQRATFARQLLPWFARGYYPELSGLLVFSIAALHWLTSEGPCRHFFLCSFVMGLARSE